MSLRNELIPRIVGGRLRGMSHEVPRMESRGIREKIESWGSSFILELIKFNWFTVLAAASTVIVFGSFVAMTMQALWWNYADVLLPMKVAIPMGYGAILFHMLRQVMVFLKKQEPGSALIAIIEFIMFSGSIFALQGAFQGFYGRAAYISLGEEILPLEVRVVVTLAFILPIVFLLTAGLSFIFIITIRKIVDAFLKWLREQVKALEGTRSRNTHAFEIDSR